jgi:hypothetical protein
MHAEMDAAPQDNETQSDIVERHMRAAHDAGDDTEARALFYCAQISGHSLLPYEVFMDRIEPGHPAAAARRELMSRVAVAQDGYVTLPPKGEPPKY